MTFAPLLAIVLVVGAPLSTAHAGDKQASGISHGIRQELAQARREVHSDLARAKRELDTENLRIDNSLCRQIPALRNSQQQLAASLPQFGPYATLEADDVADCENDIRREFASR